ncbi:PQQ-dependent dehydrogenase, methanol/ethanol family [Steroidobacter flavus]|uniref:PQQ-dependent dehydrogenase, methanol/ethanol family n=1 Tax=Steroidobacter flavus TaxID=1842136 RepID=A0ABV8SLM7_9GAMM
MSNAWRALSAVAVLGLLAAGCSKQEAAAPKASTDAGWLTGGHDQAQTYHSPLKQIDEANAGRLGYAWQYDLETTHGQEATPVVVDGVMYASAPWGFVHAVDARTGERRWVFDPKVDNSITSKVCCGIVSRGLAFAEGRVFTASIDGRLSALDAKDGKVLWQADTIVDHERGYTVTGSPYVAGDVVVIGNSGGELDARGYITAYKVSTGELAWRFYTVPGSSTGPFEHPELEAAAKTWDPKSRWDVGLGGTVWDGMAYDAKLDLLYVGVGNSALYPRKLRSPNGGDNLYVSSILAIHPKTGRMAWHYQTTPGDQWDYTATQKMILADLKIGDQTRQVLMQAPKNGFFYVLDRATGELLSAKPYVPVNWASGVDEKTGRPMETGLADYSNGPKLVFPSPAGGHNWHPMAFNPETGLVYIPTLEASAVFWVPAEPFVYAKGGANAGAMYAFPAAHAGNWGLESPAAKHLPPLSELGKGQPDTTIRGFLRAWDPVANKVVWEVETSGQWVGQMNAIWNGGGVMTTSGNLVFQGQSTGALHVYRATDGHPLAAIDIGTSIMAAPMTYELDGVQYVSVMAGYGGALGGVHPVGTAAERYGNAGRIVTFKIDGGPVPKPAEKEHVSSVPRPSVERFGSAADIETGNELLKRNCARCHANEGPGAIPDLRWMSAQTHQEFEDIVLKGVRASKGMGSFASLLTPAQAQQIRAAVVDSAWRAYESAQDLPQSAPHAPQTAPHVPATSPELPNSSKTVPGHEPSTGAAH